jgi:N-acetylmuramoyl-L-alanine amidase
MMSESQNVRQGDCISNIAYRNGFHWQTVWNHPDNSDLRQQREDPNALLPGDVVHIPDLVPKQEPGATEQRQRFRLRGVPAKLKLRLLVNDEPRANEPYELCVDGRWQRGDTDGDGYLEVSIPPDARTGELTVGSGEMQDRYPLRFGTVDPIDTDSGVAGRLQNLGYEQDDQDLETMIRAFQRHEGLTDTGEADASTRNRLREVFGE